MNFKSTLVEERFKEINDVLKLIIYDIDKYCQINFDKEITLTAAKSTLKEDQAVNRKHPQHLEGRAVDVRITNFTPDELVEIKKNFDDKYANQAAIGLSTGAPNLVLIKKDHLHIAIKPMNGEQTKAFVSQWEHYDESH